MKFEPSRKAIAFVLICSMVLLPAQQVLAANPHAAADRTSPANSQVVVRDVALQPGGILQGQVVDAQNNPCADMVVQVVKLGSTNETVATVRTDRQGHFQAKGLSGGVYQVASDEGGGIYRAWAANTAPPAAIPAVMVVQGQGPVRGNLGCIGPLGWALIGLGIAAAIAIPIALNNDKKSGS